MSKLTLLLAFHNHQPEGNFDHVFRVGYDDCYRPLLDAIAEFPQVRCALHHTGPLLEWLDANQPGYLNDLKLLVDRGQVEILGGGFYEPMLAVLPDQDAQGQLDLMSQFCAERFGKRPRGMWLAERVWEPALAEKIARAGLRYTIIDDTHFRYAGLVEQLFGYYVTEKAGWPIGIFPIEKELRYAIPFHSVDETIDALHGLLARAESAGKPAIVTYGDDGEKFGMWPGTKEWVWEKGWLRSFFARLSSDDKIATGVFSEVIDETLSTDRVYLPTASYEEMGEWTLPAVAQQRYQKAKQSLEQDGRFEEIRPFCRGGIWQSFMAKYPEANFMHKKMVHVSRKLAALPNAASARRELYRGQCNCAYWHGLFGGLYLNYLRHAVYSHLIAAENEADHVLGIAGHRAELLDFDADLRNEVVLSNDDLWVGIKPDLGGAFFELDVRSHRFNLANVLGRRRESYHEKLRAASQQAASGNHGDGGPKSIHDLSTVKEAGLEEFLHYDRHLRLGFVDHSLRSQTTLEDFAAVKYDELGDFATGAYRIVSINGQSPPDHQRTPASAAAATATVQLCRHGTIANPSGQHQPSLPVVVDKTYTLSGRRLTCRWRVSLLERTSVSTTVRFAPELSLTLLAGNDPARRYVVQGRTLADGEASMTSRGVLADCPRLGLVDEWSRFRVEIAANSQEAKTTFWRFPLETASQSESGFERTYQGSVIVPCWDVELLPEGKDHELSVSVEVSEL
ncbi:MAG: alpha-amylase/4-alpha-glucanotransferase domain-containing protein [Pseudomonadota bacterium]